VKINGVIFISSAEGEESYATKEASPRSILYDYTQARDAFARGSKLSIAYIEDDLVSGKALLNQLKRIQADQPGAIPQLNEIDLTKEKGRTKVEREWAKFMKDHSFDPGEATNWTTGQVMHRLSKLYPYARDTYAQLLPPGKQKVDWGAFDTYVRQNFNYNYDWQTRPNGKWQEILEFKDPTKGWVDR
jgi:hypothetical protein